MDHANDSIRWIPLLPLIAAVTSGLWLIFVRRPMPRVAVIALAVGAPIASFGLSLWLMMELVELGEDSRFLVDHVYTWIAADPFVADLGFLLDPLSAVMILVVTGVGSLIHVYSVVTWMTIIERTAASSASSAT